MKLWRITTARHAERAFDGEGARLYGGRWNHPGSAMVYTSQTLSLCALEYFVHLEPGLAPRQLVAIAAEIPDDLPIAAIAAVLEVSDLPSEWRTYPAPDSLKDLGTAWVREGRTAALSVPSSIIPHERNILINPGHPEASRIRVEPAEPFAFDPRMWKP